MHLSKNSLPHIDSGIVDVPSPALFGLPEKVVQFGTGVLLRALPDYFIDKANQAGIFNGRIVVVKSTNTGDTKSFTQQDGLYTLCVRGVEEGVDIEENRICSPISRVLSANTEWTEVLRCAQSPEVQVIISNTTEVGIQLVNESIHQQPPASFPAKLLAILYERFKKLGEASPRMVVLPTELITDNGKKLREIVTALAHFNDLENSFLKWLEETVLFCNTLVDCIVPGKPEPSLHAQLENNLGYEDALLTMSEVYRLWAIEGSEEVKTILAFAAVDNRVIITPDITKYKELKLRLLNGTHTLSCGLAHLAGIPTVRDAMGNNTFASFITTLMLDEIASAIPYDLAENEAAAFGRQVLDRFRNPHIRHQWLSITMQYTSKMAMRVVPVLLRYVERYKRIPEHMALGFAAYLLFMRAVKKEDASYWGEHNGSFHPIKDDQAKYYYDLWQQGAAEHVVHTALRNETLWGTNLAQVEGFEASVSQKMAALAKDGALK